jgi:hypothetical protein
MALRQKQHPANRPRFITLNIQNTFRNVLGVQDTLEDCRSPTSDRIPGFDISVLNGMFIGEEQARRGGSRWTGSVRSFPDPKSGMWKCLWT